MKKNILFLAILIFIFLVLDVKAEEAELKPIDYSSPVIQAVVTYQNAFRTGDIETLWRQLAKGMQRPHSNYVPLKGRDLSPREKERNVAFGNAELIGIKFITSNRACVMINVPKFPKIKEFYFIREDGEWKYARVKIYIDVVKEDLKFIAKAIKNYYKGNKKLPQTLSDLLQPIAYVNYIPLDLFSDNETPYIYKVINKTTYKLYSLGPDSDDDQGMIEYNSVVNDVWDAKYNLVGDQGMIEYNSPTYFINDGDITFNYSFNK